MQLVDYSDPNGFSSRELKVVLLAMTYIKEARELENKKKYLYKLATLTVIREKYQRHIRRAISIEFSNSLKLLYLFIDRFK